MIEQDQQRHLQQPEVVNDQGSEESRGRFNQSLKSQYGMLPPIAAGKEIQKRKRSRKFILGTESSQMSSEFSQLNRTEFSTLQASRASFNLEDQFKLALEEFDKESENQLVIQRRRRAIRDIKWCQQQSKKTQVLDLIPKFRHKLAKIQNYNVMVSSDIDVLQARTENLKLDIKMALAARTIQRYYRRYKQETNFKKSFVKMNRAAYKLQKQWRVYRLRSMRDVMLNQRKARAAVKIQA